MNRLISLLAVVALALPVAALDWAYDKQLHATASGLGAYVTCDLLADHTDWSPGVRFLVSGLAWTGVSWLHEEAMGVRDPADAQAGTIGAWAGAGLHTGMSFLVTRYSVGLGLAMRF